ncbi:MAG: phosphomannomutase/phosphoglucomutase [Bacteroidales bacterium]|nr:phosphomannomutase/phosphoglucomutase [Bacteroidales bacterium]
MGQSLSILQNSGDVRGVAMEGIIGEEVTLTKERAKQIGQGFAAWLMQRKQHREDYHLHVAIGMDGRLSGPMLADAVVESLTSVGCDVLHCGLSSTPAMLMSTTSRGADADGAIMLTGSHTTFNRNGMKFFVEGRDIDSDEMSEILRLAESNSLRKSSRGDVHIFNMMMLYAESLREKIKTSLAGQTEDDEKPLTGLKVVVDAGNGAGEFYVSRVLQPLGADTTGSTFLYPDGRFPNHSPNPEDYEALKNASAAVVEQGADIGIVFDEDVDRVAIIDKGGKAINRNEFVAMAAAIVQEEHPHTDIVTDSITSTGLSYFVEKVLGAHQCRYQRGYRNVIGEAIKKNENGVPCWLAVETSGHAAFKENNFCDDGAYFATKVIIRLAQLKKEGKTLTTLIEKLPVPIESCEYRLPITGYDFSRTAEETMRGLRQYVAQIADWEEVNQNHEGLRVMCNGAEEQGWFLCRLSLHSPVLPFNIESDKVGGVNAIVSKLKLYFRGVRDVDSTLFYQKQKK